MNYKTLPKILLTFFAIMFSISVSFATTMTLEIELPEYSDGNNHRPFVAGWIEQDNKLTKHLFVWYQYEGEDENDSLEWLQNLELWWKKGGRKLDNPVDGIAGATRKPGKYKLSFDEKELNTLKTNTDYTLNIEAVREEADRELIKLPFTIDKEFQAQRRGDVEIGEVILTITP